MANGLSIRRRTLTLHQMLRAYVASDEVQALPVDVKELMYQASLLCADLIITGVTFETCETLHETLTRAAERSPWPPQIEEMRGRAEDILIDIPLPYQPTGKAEGDEKTQGYIVDFEEWAKPKFSEN
jgi:hypothetical protein